jgi:predicted regulator of Ras-like GTPase activity (Roadblock/LC7/MglB family)
MNPQLVMYEDEFNQITAICDRLNRDASARMVFLVDKNGQLIAAAGQSQDLDTTSLASLTAGNIAATGGIAKLIGEREFSILSHQGEKESVFIALIGRVILVVIYPNSTSLGMVQLRVRKASTELGRILEGLLRKAEAPGAGSPFAEITDADIDNLFSE